ncbi:MAG: threonine/serine exporter family protein [Clostridiales bacterium]|jgi:uncharacterized membrane protein YjjP (DUF1212 family)|nr:threonine/serine exporter family protein [Clostridiales bacterium]
MDTADSVNIALLAGDIMLSNGAETYRVEDTARRILAALGQENAQAYVTATGIFISAGVEPPITGIKRVKTRSYHMEKIARVNDLSRGLSSGEIQCADAESELIRIANLPPYPAALRITCSGVSSFCFCYMFGGLWRDSVCALLCGLLVYFTLNLLSGRCVSTFLSNIICGALISVLTLALLNLRLGVNMDKIIVGAIMPLVPGIAMTNAMRDILEGDFVSGLSRATEALVTAAAIAAGVGLILGGWLRIYGGFIQ